MHFEFLVEGQADLTTLSILMAKILGTYGEPHTWKIHKHRGIGKLPEKPKERPNTRDQTLLHNLPSKLRAYGLEKREDLTIVVLVDLDDRPDCVAFKAELSSLLDICPEKPKALFRIAIEEIEAWLLGDSAAITGAFPNAEIQKLEHYEQDSQCGTWEKLADIIHPGGIAALHSSGKRSVIVLEEKRRWAAAICPYMDIETNRSPSFRIFRDGIRNIAAT